MRAHRSWLVATASAALLAACDGAMRPGSDEWPNRPVRLIVPFGAENSNDLVARLYAPLLSARWRRAVVVDNRPGGDGAAGMQAFVTANDEHTLLLAPTGMVTVNPLLHDRLPYDPQHDLVPLLTLGLPSNMCLSATIATIPDTEQVPLLEEGGIEAFLQRATSTNRGLTGAATRPLAIHARGAFP